MKRYWFKRKTYGWGWYPATWEGWLILLLWVLVVIFLLRNVSEKNSSAVLVAIFLPYGISIAALIGICFWKGEKPKWQWGEKKDLEK